MESTFGFLHDGKSAVMLTRPDQSRPRPRPKPFHNAKTYDKR